MRKSSALLVGIMIFSLYSCKPKDSYYKVTWLNYDQSVLEVDEKVKEGEIPEFNSGTPVKPSDNSSDFEFSGWDKEFEPIKEDMEFVATFNEEIRKGQITASHQSGFYNDSFSFRVSGIGRFFPAAGD